MARKGSKVRRHPKARPQGVLDLTPQGFGFVKTAEGEYFIPAAKIGGAFPGDLVEVARLPSHEAQGAHSDARRLPAARVARVLMRARDTLIGRYEVAEPFGVVVPEEATIPYDIFTLRRDAPDVPDGAIVEIRINEFPSRNTAATGTVVRVLGDAEDLDVAIDLIVADHGFETAFSEAALEEAAAARIDVKHALRHGYRDLRNAFVFTIDPVDARDFDDAVSLERDGDCFRLGVHIADVSRFVAYGGSLDLDARRRATSVYLVDRVIPMLPEQLSNHLCSLVPREDRLTLSVEALVTPEGRVKSYEVFPSVICSSARLSYDQAQALIDAHRAGVESVSEARLAVQRCDVPHASLPLDDVALARLMERIPEADRLAKALFARRLADGCMDFDRVEAKALLDEAGRATGIAYRRRTDATELIEEAMILANHLVAEWLVDRNLPCVFRIHGQPEGDGLRELYEVLQETPFFTDIDKRAFCAGDPLALQEVLARASGLPQQELVNTLLLRAMKRAVYSAYGDFHYGLALGTYCHFTSPIRRYPDLLVHRMVKQGIFGQTPGFAAQKASLAWLAEHSSKMEREAEAAARESQLTKICEYLQGFVGSTFSGVVSQVTTFGITVRLECTAHGTIPTDELGDEYFSYDPQRQSLRGEATGRVFRLGQRVEVVLVASHPRARRLTLRLSQGMSCR